MKRVKLAIKTGFGFGITSAVITTLGLMIGLNAGTNSKLVVIGGILTIAIADAFSDALGIHISEESDKKNTEKQVWAATLSAFISKLLFALTFLIPLLLTNLTTAIFINIGWGLLLLGVFSYLMAKTRAENPFKVVGEHLSIAFLVIIITHYFGLWIATLFA